MRSLVLPIIAATLSLAVATAAPAYTIQDVMSAPFPSDLAAAPHGDAFAWVMNAEGVRNIWIAQAPDFKPLKVTSFTEDDGQPISELAWIPDGSAVLFTRGGNANSKGEFPNPFARTDGARQEVWIAPIPGTAHKLGDGHSPAVSPNGRIAAWLQGGSIWSVELPAAKSPVQVLHARSLVEEQPTEQAKVRVIRPPSSSTGPAIAQSPQQLIHERGSAEALVWSPDSTRVAFTSDRTDHSFIAIYDFRDKSLNFVDAAADLDQSPVWSPDGREIAFIRVPGSRYALAWGPKRTGQPWSIRIADAKSGKGREVWRAHEGMGSVFWPVGTGTSQLLWSGEGRIVFPWEADGWLHLYSMSPQGGQTVSLTPGNFEVENVALTVDGKGVVFSSNQNDIDRRHLWSVGIGGGPVSQLTRGTGIEARPLTLAGGAVGFVRSEAMAPPRIALLATQSGKGEAHDLTADQIPADFPSDALVVPQLVEFTAADGVRIHAQLFRSANGSPGRHPAVVFLHGGSRRQMVLGWHYMSYYSQAYAFNQYLASKGYIVLSVNYRSGTGYGEQFRETLNYGATGGSEFADVKAAGNYLRDRADVVSSRIGIWGGSYGGYLTAMALARASDLFAAGVDLHGVHDWNLEITNYVPTYEAAKHQAVATTAFQSSPMAFLDTWKSPVLLIHGDDDRNVTFSQTVLLEESLRERGVHFEELVFPDEVHEFLVHAHWLTAYNAADEFLGKYLESKKPEIRSQK